METDDKKRYCLALDLKNDPKKIQAYIDHHKNVWPEIKESIKRKNEETCNPNGYTLWSSKR